MNNTNKYKKNKSKIYCSNCGRSSHLYRNCREPIISYGIINFLISSDDNIITKNIINRLSIDVEKDDDLNNIGATCAESKGIIFKNPDDIKVFGAYKDKIQFLMIQRKHTLGYIEFIRGRYVIDNVDGIIFLFRQMTAKEIAKVGEYTFDELWKDLWPSVKSNYQTEYITSKNKYEKLKNAVDEDYLNLEFYVKHVQPNWEYPEWGFPKGRRNYKETDIMCAIREFEEESGFIDKEYVILDKLIPIHETLVGTNGIHYKHIYYPTISMTKRAPTIDEDNKDQIDEIGNIGWFTYEEAMKIIRPHHTERRRILTQLYMYIINVILRIMKKNKLTHEIM